MPSYLLVMLGGALGAAARHFVSRALLALWGPHFPWGTLAVNLVGGFAMGLLAASLPRLGLASDPWRLLLGVGVLGGFTTFSAFSLDVVLMLERGAWAPALGYVLASVIGAVLALAGGMALARSLA